jgi:hypothetical protein
MRLTKQKQIVPVGNTGMVQWRFRKIARADGGLVRAGKLAAIVANQRRDRGSACAMLIRRRRDRPA